MDLLGLSNAMKELLIVHTLMEYPSLMVTPVTASVYGPMLVVRLRIELLIMTVPCNTGSSIQAPPPFVGNDFYCESASNAGALFDKLYNTDPLWNGQECTGL